MPTTLYIYFHVLQELNAPYVTTESPPPTASWVAVDLHECFWGWLCWPGLIIEFNKICQQFSYSMPPRNDRPNQCRVWSDQLWHLVRVFPTNVHSSCSCFNFFVNNLKLFTTRYREDEVTNPDTFVSFLLQQILFVLWCTSYD